ncbi:SPOR and LysM peptidoglycan-binding domain-containing protein [Psychrobacter sp. I-STPA6b]|uniref:SPOR and LysM peptidoglycan-binding domain-containing protein n=1 Tax=Psychrobacter sp. I-STPA6b TaxID=2585718 RepID=UPI001D0C318A|nr:SPOR domain-containing protein [Psychrobacter sp. I-STPA6b]
MNLSRQTLLGLGVFLGGSLMLFAMVQQIERSPSVTDTAQSNAIEVATDSENKDGSSALTADIETEQRILAQKQKERAARVAEQERRAQAFLEEQAHAEELALKKARLESEQYRNNTLEPIQTEEAAESSTARSQVQVVTPVVQPRQAPIVTRQPEETVQHNTRASSADQANSRQADEKQPTNRNTNRTSETNTEQPAKTSPQRPEEYRVRRGDGLIKIARQYNMPVEVLASANNLSTNTELRLGQTLKIPSAQQVQRLQRVAQNTATDNKNDRSNTNTASPQSKPEQAEQQRTTTAPTRALDYKVQRGDGLIKLSREYNVPVDALAQANGLSTSANLRVGQTLTIPSRAQVTRLQREAAQAQRRAEAAQTAEQRLAVARRAAAQGEARGKFGVQVALADNQAKADEVAQKMKAAGYSVTTSATSRGVRVIVGPETGKPAALALKDKINADPNTGVHNAWVLYWR